MNPIHTPYPLPEIPGKNRNPWGQLRGQLFGARCPQIREGRTGDALKFERVTYKDAKVNGIVNTVDPKKSRCRMRCQSRRGVAGCDPKKSNAPAGGCH